MSNATNYLEGKILDSVLRGEAFPSITEGFVCLFTGDPGEAGSMTNEVADDFDYARVAISLDGAGTGTGSNDAEVDFGVANGGGWGTITHVGIADSGTHGGGNLLLYGEVGTSRTVNDGDAVKIPLSAITVTVD